MLPTPLPNMNLNTTATATSGAKGGQIGGSTINIAPPGSLTTTQYMLVGGAVLVAFILFKK